MIGADHDCDWEGRVYVFVRSGDTWSRQLPELCPDQDCGTCKFGSSVALSGDTAVVGAPGCKLEGAAGRGAAYVFTRRSSGWSMRGQMVAASDGTAGDHFGCSVGVSGQTIVVGAKYYDAGSYSYDGAAYIFTPSQGTWCQWGNPLAGSAGSDFGFSVAVSGKTVVIGAPGEYAGSPNRQGVAHVALAPCVITAHVEGGHGTVAPAAAQTVAQGATPTFTFVPDVGYHISAVMVDGVPASMTGSDEYRFPAVLDDHTLSVRFAADSFTITPSVVGGNGSITPSTPQTFAYGSTPTYAFTPDSGYRVSEVRVDDELVAMTGPGEYTFPPIAADHQISAAFRTATAPTLRIVALPPRVLVGREFRIVGTLRPRFAAAVKTVAVEVHRRSRSGWTLYKSRSAVNADYRSYTKWVARLTIARRGTYRFRARTRATGEWLATRTGFTRVMIVR
jgi:hypothetical protein